MKIKWIFSSCINFILESYPDDKCTQIVFPPMLESNIFNIVTSK